MMTLVYMISCFPRISGSSPVRENSGKFKVEEKSGKFKVREKWGKFEGGNHKFTVGGKGRGIQG